MGSCLILEQLIFSADASYHGLVLCVSPVRELVVASGVTQIFVVDLLDVGSNFGELFQAHVELVDVFVHRAEFGAVTIVFVLDRAGCIGSSENSADGKGFHRVFFSYNSKYLY